MKQNKLSDFILGLIVIMIYGIMGLTNLQSLPFELLHVNLKIVPNFIILLYSLSYQILMLAIVAFLFRKRLKKDLKDLRQHHKEYFHKYFKYWFLVLGLMMLSNLLIQFIMPDQIAGNEEAIRNIFQVSPIYIFIASVLIAPFLEELVFRLGIRYMFPTDWLFILISGIVFGALHVIGNVEVPLDWLYIIPYSIPGFIFAYVLSKSDNIFTTMGLHFLHNGILMSFQFLVYIFMR